MSAIFLVATSVTAATAPHEAPVLNLQRSPSDMPKSEATPDTDAPQHLHTDSESPSSNGPIFIESNAPTTSAPVGTMPTAVPPASDSAPAEINPRQNPQGKQRK